MKSSLSRRAAAWYSHTNERPDKEGMPSAGRIYKHFNTVWRCILAKFVGPLPPATSYAMRPVSCNCRDCAYLNRFLASAYQTQLKFPADKYRRQHFHQMLDISHYGTVTHETQRTGHPESLIVTKKSGEKSKSQRVAWTKRATQARDSLFGIPEEVLRKALQVQFLYALPKTTMKAIFGEYWEWVCAMCPSDAPQSNASAEQGSSDMRSQATSGAHSVVPAKRKAETDVVDLTDD